MRLATAILLVLMIAASAGAQSYQIGWSVIGSGGCTSTAGSYKLSATVGQPAAGFVQNVNYLHWIGFWGGDVPQPTPCATVADAKLLPDGTFVSVAGKVATSAIGDFAGFFYVEESNRTSGLRVAVPPDQVAGLARGSVVNVIGTLNTTSAGEREMAGPMVIIISTTTPLAPHGMTNKALGGASFGVPLAGQLGVTGGVGTNTVGLLVRTWGKVTYSGADVLISDGSGVVVKIDTSALIAPPADGSDVAVTGISSLWKPSSDYLRLILPRGDNDIN